MSRLGVFCVFGLVIVSQLACSSGGSEQINYRDSQVTPTLEIPPDLISRSSDNNLDLPGSAVGTPANSGRFVETGALDIDVRTLPQVDGMQVQGQGDWYWLEVSKPAQQGYPQVREFWAEQGFRLLVDEPAIGVMETEWLPMKSASDSFFSTLLASMRAAESKDQYKTRLQRGPSPATTQVYIAHRGQELVIDDQETGSAAFPGNQRGWKMMPSDPGKEYEMLSRLMIYLGMQQPAVKRELEKIGLFAPRASLANYDDDEDDTHSYLLVKQGFTQTWNRFTHQMDRLNINLQEIKKGDQEASLQIAVNSILPAVKSDQQYFWINIEGADYSNNTRIEVLNENGAVNPSSEARQLLRFLLQQLK